MEEARYVSPVEAVRARGPAPTDLRREHCPLCGDRDLRPCVDLPHSRLLECNKCGLCSTEELGSQTAVASYYSQRQAHGGKLNPDDSLPETIAAQQANYLLDMVDCKEPGSFLELGCASGHLLEQMERRGWHCTGVDLSIAGLSSAKTRVAGQLHQGTVQDCGAGSESFDCVAAFDLLAHLAEPVETIQKVADLLRPGGWLVLSTVNEGWPLVPVFRRLFAVLPERTSGLRDEMYEAQHYCYFSDTNIKELLGRAGLELSQTRPMPPLSAVYLRHQYGLPKRLALTGMMTIDRLLGSSRKMLVAAQKPLAGAAKR